MLEFVINRHDDNGYPSFDLPINQWEATLRANTLPTKILPGSEMGNLTIEVANYQINFIDEMFGLQVVIESKEMPYELARSIIEEVHHNIEEATGETYELLEMLSDRPFQFA